MNDPKGNPSSSELPENDLSDAEETVVNPNPPEDARLTTPVAGSSHSQKEPERFPLPEVNGYSILEEIGRGGMGVVYKAQQNSLNRLVALKMIRDSALASEKQRARFATEAAAVARLQHPNIVQIFDLNKDYERPYFSMELVPGENLAQILEREKTLPPAEAAHLIECLARAVHYAHQQGIVHRDLKPANILIRGSGQTKGEPFRLHAPSVKITDFGLAKQLDTHLSHTPTLSVMGTPSYMAPEQAEGALEVTGAVDVYSLGTILYETLTGRAPFEGESTLSILDKVRYQPPVPPRKLNPEIPPELETICLRCLEKVPEARYPSAAALAEDLQNFLQGKPLHPGSGKKKPSEKVIEQYEIEGEQQRGGLWVVYQAKDPKKEQTVALKRIRPGSAPTAEQITRLRATIEVARNLEHPAIVPYLDVGGTGEGFYFTMEFIEGRTLEQAVKGKTLPPAEAAELCLLMAEGLHHAHETGLVHCHLEMSNILLKPVEEKSESPVLRDLGAPTLIGYEMARRRDDKEGHHDLETIRPTSHAMAPEQLFNQPGNIGPATDVYSLGVILYELLTGQPPYRAKTTSDLLLKVGFEILQPPHRINSDVPMSLSLICLKCMQVELDKRYRSAKELVDDLKAFQEGKPTSADKPPLWQKVWNWIRVRILGPAQPRPQTQS